MAYRLIWSPTSLKDVDEIAAFIDRSSPRYARVVARKIFASVEHLKEMPLA